MHTLQTRYRGVSASVLGLVALCAATVWQTGRSADDPPGSTTAAEPAPQPVPLSLLPDYQIEGGIASRRDTVERPAFVPTRRPAPAAVQEAPRPKMPRNQFTLTGTAVVDQKQIAFLRETAGGKARTVRAGETINGVVVAEVKADRVRLVMGDESEVLTLKVAAGPRQTVQPPVPGAPPVAAPGQPPARPPVGNQPIAADTGRPVDSDATILERRRAARAALQAQQEAAARAGGQPAPAAPAAPGLAVPQSGTRARGDGQPDPAWNEVYRRMQQPRQ